MNIKQTKMKSYLPFSGYNTLILIATALFFAQPITSQNNNTNTSAESNGKGKFELFREELPFGARLADEDKFIRHGGYTESSRKYIYVNPDDSPAEITGLSIPIRENPGPGEYRYITFTWIKWGHGQIGLKIGNKTSSKYPNQTGKDLNYTYYAGEGNFFSKGIKLSENASPNWVVISRDLWKDFGDFTLTGTSLICPDSRDAGFDAIYLGQSMEAFDDVPQLIPSEIATPVIIDEDGNMQLSDSFTEDSSEYESEKVTIDWVAQLEAGGIWMYPIYLLGIAALIITIQRLFISREVNLAPKKLRVATRKALANKDVNTAIDACDKYPSTLANSLRFIFTHRKAPMEAVSQGAGDIAVRDIRKHIASISPLSVIASVAPLLGLLGTIVGMVEAFALVALYGDEGGASILSDSISKALMTTMAGLIVAAPSVIIYFVIKNRIMSISSKIEEEVENAINELYLDDDAIVLSEESERRDENETTN